MCRLLFYYPTLTERDLRYSHGESKKQNKQTKQYSKFQIRQIPMKFTFPKDAFLVYETHTGEDKSSVPTYYIPRPNAMLFNAIVH